MTRKTTLSCKSQNSTLKRNKRTQQQEKHRDNNDDNHNMIKHTTNCKNGSTAGQNNEKEAHKPNLI